MDPDELFHFEFQMYDKPEQIIMIALGAALAIGAEGYSEHIPDHLKMAALALGEKVIERLKELGTLDG